MSDHELPSPSSSSKEPRDTDLVGYELIVPWMQEVFGPTSTMRTRICLECYGSTGGMRGKALTRQEVVDAYEALRAQGIMNFGGTDLCWRCGKNLVTGKRERGLRVIKPGEYMDIIPPAEQDAQWHLTREAGKIWCPHCRDYSYEQPGVKRYHAELDPAGVAAERYPGWTEAGWLAWYECDNCGIQRKRPVSAKKVAQWGQELGGWVLEKNQES